MNNWKLVYCFSKLLSYDDNNFNIILYSLSKSIEFNSKFHQIKIYTDKFTYDFIKHLNVDIEIYDYTHFRFIDDIKIQTLSLLDDNEILIDPDVFLYKELIIDKNCDVFLERPEKITDPWYREDYDISLKFKFSKMIEFNSKSGDVGNIGIIKFFNIDFMNQYITQYDKIKELAEEELDKLSPFPRFSILLGQLGLQNLVDKKNYTVVYAKFTKGNKYIHLAGEQKYKIGYIDTIFKPKYLL
jgi:hypothetical protein